MLNWIKNVLQSPIHPANYLQAATMTKTIDLTAGANKASHKEQQTAQPPLRVAKLIMVTANNNNKFYEMREQSDGTFTVNYGRVGTAGTTTSYPIQLWDQKIREKTRKGYKDQTHLFATQTENSLGLESIEAEAVKDLIQTLMQAARRSIRHNYYVSAEEVTQLQVEEAQALIDQLVDKLRLKMDADSFNQLLLELYQIIPRRMTNVRKHLIEKPQDQKALSAIRDRLGKEQETLDVMRGQVELNEQKNKKQETTSVDFLTAMGLKVELVEDIKAIQMIKKMMGGSASKFHRAYRVINLKTQTAFDQYLNQSDNQKIELFWHGSRNENWMSIINSGLVLRPASAVITGKMFGYGLYFADKCKKSLNYTSLRGSYWANGTKNQGFLALYDVHVGTQLKIKKHQSWCYQLTEAKLKARGTQYDSLFAKGGADLINNEFIVYNEAQATIRYLIEIR